MGFILFGWWALVERDRTHVVADVLGPALFVWTWIGETVAHALFFEGYVVAVASFVAMGIFAVPAILRLRVLERRR